MSRTPLRTLDANAPVATPAAKPRPAAHCLTPTQNAGSRFSEGDAAAVSPSQVITECMCQSCQYYRAAMLFHHHHGSDPAHAAQLAGAAHAAHAAHAEGGSPLPLAPLGLSPMQEQFSPYAHGGGGFGAATAAGTNLFPGHGRAPSAGVMVGALAQRSMPHLSSTRDSVDSAATAAPVPPAALAQFAEVAAAGRLAAVACSAAGRSLIQNVLRLCEPAHVAALHSAVLDDLEAVALDTHGCHVLRSLLDALAPPQLAELTAALDETLVLNLATVSQFTRRVLQALLERPGDAILEPVLAAMARNALYLAATQQGCIALMRAFELAPAEDQARLAAPLLPVLAELACDPYGNYVVQCVAERSADVAAAHRMLRSAFGGRLLRLACNKFASNVLEKVARFAAPHGQPAAAAAVAEMRQAMLDELVFNPAALQQLVHDGFGNFVIQALLATTPTPQEHRQLCERLRPLTATSPYGHKIESRMRARHQGPAAGPPGSRARHSAPRPAATAPMALPTPLSQQQRRYGAAPQGARPQRDGRRTLATAALAC